MYLISKMLEGKESNVFVLKKNGLSTAQMQRRCNLVVEDAKHCLQSDPFKVYSLCWILQRPMCPSWHHVIFSNLVISCVLWYHQGCKLTSEPIPILSGCLVSNPSSMTRGVQNALKYRVQGLDCDLTPHGPIWTLISIQAPLNAIYSVINYHRIYCIKFDHPWHKFRCGKPVNNFGQVSEGL